MEGIETLEEKTGAKGSFVEVSSRKVPKEVTENSSDSYFDGSLLGLLAFSYFYATITVITAGLLSAWGKCLLNEYIYNHTVISGKRLKFEGSGKDLFPRMFKWDFFKLITFNIYSIWVPTRYKEWEVSKLHFEDEKLVEGDSYFTGTVGAYFGINLLYWLITTVSFGLLEPIAYVIRLKWELNHTIINKKVVVFRGSAGAYFGKRILWTLLSMVTFGIYGLWFKINTLKWQFSNTFLLRKGEKDGNIPENVSVDSNGASIPVQSKKGVSKPVLFAVLGVVAIIFIIIIINIITLFGDAKPEIEEEIRNVAVETNNYIKQYGVPYADDGLDKGFPYKNIKKLHIDALDNFRKSGGKGWTEYYDSYEKEDYYTGEYNNDIYIELVLRKKSTICKVVVSTRYDEPNVKCNSVKGFFAERLNINGGTGFSNAKSLSDTYESNYMY